MTVKELIEAIEKEQEAIMTVQDDILDTDSEQYKLNQEALRRYVDMIDILKRSEREDRELNMREKELFERIESERQKHKSETTKYIVGALLLAALVTMIVFSEGTRVISSKAFSPIANAAVRLFTVI